MLLMYINFTVAEALGNVTPLSTLQVWFNLVN
jgi:hypothetical protein